jgi:hypothetical protein
MGDGLAQFEFGGGNASPIKSRRFASNRKHPVKATAEAAKPTADALAAIQPKGTRFESKDK